MNCALDVIPEEHIKGGRRKNPYFLGFSGTLFALLEIPGLVAKGRNA
jgi:hypothetical protein